MEYVEYIDEKSARKIDEKMCDEVREIISKVSRVKKEKITDTVSLRFELMLNSMQAVHILSVIDDRFGVNIDPIEIFNVETVPEIVELILEYREINGAGKKED